MRGERSIEPHCRGRRGTDPWGRALGRETLDVCWSAARRGRRRPPALVRAGNRGRAGRLAGRINSVPPDQSRSCMRASQSMPTARGRRCRRRPLPGGAAPSGPAGVQGELHRCGSRPGPAARALVPRRLWRHGRRRRRPDHPRVLYPSRQARSLPAREAGIPCGRGGRGVAAAHAAALARRSTRRRVRAPAGVRSARPSRARRRSRGRSGSATLPARRIRSSAKA